MNLTTDDLIRMGKSHLLLNDSKATASQPAPLARARVRTAPSGMNKTEQRYADHLERLRIAREVFWYRFGGVTLVLADRTTYTPDFLVVMADQSLKFVEIKGFLHDDASVKFKVAAEMNPWARFEMLRWKKGSWRVIKSL